ncbi:MAG: hypothetical protein Tsb0020_24300 [Haliangiales bacterium]
MAHYQDPSPEVTSHSPAQTQRATSSQRAQTNTERLPSRRSAPAPVVQRRADGSAAPPLPFTGLRADLAAAAFRPDLAAPPATPAVQARGDIARDSSPVQKSVHESAAAGVSGSGSALPHLDRIQQAFGPSHDVSQVKAHVGGAAAQASEAIGAEAYATGNDVAFRSTPDLHTAAHEAAHVVQQRQGVSLQGGVGQAGDSYEKHADAVADAVVAGRSAESLLSPSGASTAPASGVQAKAASATGQLSDHVGQAQVTASMAGAASAAPVGAVVQRFESDEHREIGDDATAGESGEKKTVELAADYRLTYGEMVAMAGDFFTDIAEMRTLAGNAGTGAGTREELEYVRVCKVHGRDDESSYSEAARKAADKRYYQLAAGNRSHFLNPEKGDTERATADKIDDTVTETGFDLASLKAKVTETPSGAPGYYREYHLQAMAEAMIAARAGATIDTALAAEAFGAHYLTDMFAAGHTRTPRGSITEHWNAKVPMFFYNFKGFLAESLANYINDNNWRGIATVDYIYEEAKAALEAKLEEQGLPDFTFGDLVSGAVHDYDNKHGVDVSVDGSDKTLFGDGSLAKGDTKAVAMAAVQAGVSDVETAYSLASAGGGAAEVVAELFHDSLFPPERLIPVVTPDAQLSESKKSVPWEYDDYMQLLSDGKFQSALQIVMEEKQGELAKVGSSLDEEYQRTAFQNGVLVKMSGFQGVQTVADIIQWTPNTGGGVGGHNQDDNAVDYWEEAKSKDAMDTLTYVQRVNLMVDLLDGSCVGDDEDAVMDILTSASDSDARRLIARFGWEYLYDKIDDGPGEVFAETFPEDKYGGD